MRRLLVFMPSLDRGGCEEYGLSMVRAARTRGWQVAAAFPSTPKTNSLVNDFSAAGAEFHPWIVHREQEDSWGDHEEQRRAAEVLFDRCRPDRILFALPWPDSALGVIEAAGTQALRGAAVFQLSSEPVDIPRRAREQAEFARRRGLSWVAVSRENRAHLAATFQMPEEEIVVVHNGGPRPENWMEDPSKRAQIRMQVRAELGLNIGARLVITVGRLSEQKGYQDYLPLVSGLVADFPDIQLVWVGHGELEPWIRRGLAEKKLESRVTILQHRKDVLRLLVASDLFVLPSRLEGAPFAVLEAMACGCPVIATAVGGTPEVIESGRSGVIIPPGASVELDRALRTLLRDSPRAEELAKSARERVQDFGQEQMFARTFELLG